MEGHVSLIIICNIKECGKRYIMNCSNSADISEETLFHVFTPDVMLHQPHLLNVMCNELHQVLFFFKNTFDRNILLDGKKVD